MKKNMVPQDSSRTYGGHKKVIYATDDSGSYDRVESSGWESEEFVTVMAVEEIESQRAEAYERVKNGVTSPLEFHMYDKRLDVLALAQISGFFQWQIKRHFKPNIFAKLSQKKLARYCDAMGLNLEQLKSLPEQ